MPFNPSGIFERIFSWVTDRDNGVKILAQRVDDETNGIVAGINQLTSGAVGFRGPIKTVNGTKGTPSFAFKDDPNTGIYRVSEDVLGLTGGTGDLQIGPSTLTYNGGKVYHVGARPTAAEVGARPTADTPSLAGANTFEAANTFVQPVNVDSANWVKMRLRGTASAIIEAYDTTGTRYGSITFDNQSNSFHAFLEAGGGQPSARLELNRNGSLRVNGNAVYHAGNKPTPADASAVSAAGYIDPGAVQSAVWLRSTAARSVGEPAPGSTLTVAGMTSAGALHVGATTMSGTWKTMGTCPANGATLFIRIL